MAQGTTVATAYVQVMPSMDGATTNITNAMLPQMDAAGASIGSALGASTGAKFSGMLSKVLPAATVSAVALAAGKALKDIGEEFDAMTDAIIVGTGASGEALDSLVSSAKSIGSAVPADFEKVGDVVQNLNTRMGLMGDDLEALGERVLAASKMLGTEINLDTLTGALNAYGVANDQAAAKMDYLFNVSQATGIGFNDLTKIMETTAPSLQNLGFSFEQSANMAGLLDKAGLNASGTMGKMSKALVELSQPGESAADAYRRVVSEMEEYIKAGDTAAALDIASKVFGTKGAADFVGALQSGAISMDELTDSALGAGDGIMATMQKTLDWDESWQVLQNNIKVALEPLASGVLEGIAAAVQKLTEFVTENSESFQALGEVLGYVADFAGMVLGPALDTVGDILGTVMGAVSSLISTFKDLASTASSVWDSIVSTIGGAIDRIKSLFDFDFHLPDLKLPHIVVGEYIDVPVLGRIPNPTTLHVEWYAQGGIVNGPTLLGAGEAGPEAIVPLTAPNLEPFAAAVADRIEGKGDTFVFNITADSTTTLDSLINQARRARTLQGAY